MNKQFRHLVIKLLVRILWAINRPFDETDNEWQGDKELTTEADEYLKLDQ